MKRALGVFKSSKNITAISVAVFIVTVLLLASSTYYINVCIGNEEQANADYSVCKQMGTDLADASDYHTTEVRLFAVTHSIEHFYNYWKEINDTKTRDNVITQFEERDAPDNETAYLKEAKYYSDELVKIETYSMKMVLMSEHKDASSFPDDVKLQGYVRNVLNCELPDKYKALNDEEMAAKAIDILFNHTYDNYKDSIMNPIDTFQTLINTRLEQEVKSAKKGTAFATVLLAAATVITLIATGGLLILLNKMYVIPIRKYTDCIHSADVSPERKKGTYSSIHNLAVKVVPQGSLKANKVDVVFTDIRMPEMDGIALLKEIRRQKIDVFVVLVSLYKEFEYAREGLKYGAVDYIMKPIEEKALDETLSGVRSCLDEFNMNAEYKRIIDEKFNELGPEGNDAFIINLKNILAQNPESNLSMDEFAKYLGFSKDYFGKMVKQKTGVSFNKLLTSIKMQYSKTYRS